MASIDGLASGLNTTDIIRQLMQLERQPQVRLQGRQKAAETAITSLRALNTKFLAVAAAAQKLGAVRPAPAVTAADAGTWTTVKASSSDSARVSVSAVPGAPASSLAFHVKQLASAASSLTDRTWSAVDEAFGSGTSVTITKSDGSSTVIPTGSGTLAETAAAITRSSAGVTASVVLLTPGTPAGPGTPEVPPVHGLALSSTTMGSRGDFVLSDGDGPMAPRQGTVNPGRDAVLHVGGVEITRPGNTISDVLTGVTLTLTRADAWTTDGTTTAFAEPPVLLSVTSDDQGLTDRVSALVDAVNAATKDAKNLTSADAVARTRGALYGDGAVRGLVDTVRRAVSGASGAGALAGVTVTRDGTVVFDKDVFRKALADDPAAVEAALGEAGLAGRLDDVADLATRPLTAPPAAGVIAGAIRDREDRISGFQTSIASWDDRLLRRQQTLQRQYAGLERALGAAQSQGQWLSGQLANLPKWS